jgi:hypothetical protein
MDAAGKKGGFLFTRGVDVEHKNAVSFTQVLFKDLGQYGEVQSPKYKNVGTRTDPVSQSRVDGK